MATNKSWRMPFLDSRMRWAIRCDEGGDRIVCRMTAIYYLSWLCVGFLLGPGITFTVFVPLLRISPQSSPVISIPAKFSMRSAPVRDVPVPAALALGLASVIGWLMVQSNLMWRRRVTVDRNQIELSERIFRKTKEVILLGDVASLEVSQIQVRQRSKGLPTYVTMFRADLHLKDGEQRCLVRTVNRNVVEAVVTWSNTAVSQCNARYTRAS